LPRAKKPQSSLLFERTRLPNGIRVVTGNLPHTKAVSINFLFGAGSRYETDKLAGASHLFEHMLFKGTHKRPTPREIVEVVEGVGGTLNAFTERELTGYWCRLALPHYRQGLDLLADMVSNSILREDDITREKPVVYEEIRASNDSPGGRVSLLLDQLMWPDQPLGRDIAGSVESVSAITRDEMLEYLHAQYISTNLVIAVAGNIQHKDIVDQVQEALGDYRDAKPYDIFPFKDKLAGPAVCVEKRDTEQAHVAIGIHGLSMFDKDRHALSLLSVILGETMSSRLFEEIREQRGLAYDIHSGVGQFRDAGALFVECGLDPERTLEAIPLIVDEVAKMRDGVTEREHSQAIELTKGRMMLRMEESRAVAGFMGSQELLRNEIRTVEQVVADIEAVTAEDIKRVAEKVIRPEKMAMAIVGPLEDSEPFLKAMEIGK
jgi:predicted Zn-dependent peptidase